MGALLCTRGKLIGPGLLQLSRRGPQATGASPAISHAQPEEAVPVFLECGVSCLLGIIGCSSRVAQG